MALATTASSGLFEPMVRQRVRIRFSKSGNLKYIGHKDLLRSFEAIFRRARVPLAMSGGFHPKIRMSLPSALALGIEGFDEVLELEMSESAETVDSDDLLTDLNRHTIGGLNFLTARTLGEKEKKAKLYSSTFQLLVPKELQEGLPGRIDELLAEESVMVQKSNGKSVDARKALVDIVFSSQENSLTFEILTQHGPEAGVKEILKALVLEQELFKNLFPRRIRCRLAEDAPDGIAVPALPENNSAKN